jgi:hypothetical protein
MARPANCVKNGMFFQLKFARNKCTDTKKRGITGNQKMRVTCRRTDWTEALFDGSIDESSFQR